MIEPPSIKILFVCMGNICRSPAAEGILKHLAQNEKDIKIEVESCGIGDWHIGRLPDRRMCEASETRGIYLKSRAQQFQKWFFDHFDYILAADQEVFKWLCHEANTPQDRAKIRLMTAFSRLYKDQEVPDPYLQGRQGFDLVMDMLEDSCQELIAYLKKDQKI